MSVATDRAHGPVSGAALALVATLVVATSRSSAAWPRVLGHRLVQRLEPAELLRDE